MNCYLIDDYPVIFETLTDFILKTEGLELVGTQTNSILALEYLTSGEVDVDLIFLDVEMSGINGLELAQKLGSKFKIILVTGNYIYAEEAYNIRASYFLHKPVSYDRFLQAINRVRAELGLPETENAERCKPGINSVLIKGSGKGSWEKLNYDDIIYIKSDSTSIDFFLKNGKRTIYFTLRKFMDLAPKNRFVQTHKSYVINLDYVVKGNAEDIYLINNIEVPLGPTFKDLVKEKLLGNCSSML